MFHVRIIRLSGYELTNRVPNNKIPLLLSENPITNASSKVFIALVNLVEYYKFITNEKGELVRHIFEANVRDYQGDVSVNKDIYETLEHTSSENFWWLNNGTTIVASDATWTIGKTLVLTDPEIVNGLQTSTEIYNYFKNKPDRLNSETRDLLVRIIVPEIEESRDKIIFATNNQTPILKPYLRATEAIHRQIEMYFKEKSLYYDRRKNYYKNNGKKAAQIVSLPFLSQCLISVLLQSPNDARARPSTLLTDIRHDELFKENQNLDVFYHIAYIGKKVEHVLKTSAELTNTQVTDMKFYTIYAIFAKLVRKIVISPKDVIALQITTVSDEIIMQTARFVLEVYNNLGGNDRVAKGSEFIVELKNRLQAEL